MTETTRRFVRKIVRYDSCIYKFVSKFVDFIFTIRKDGFNTWQILQSLKDEKHNDVTLTSVSLKNLKYPILIRSSSTDTSTIINNVIREEYGNFELAKQPEWMIDAGAYIGDTTAYFLSRFPKLKVIALEPNPASYEMARQNLSPYGDKAILLKKGLYTKETLQHFSSQGTGSKISSTGFEIDCTSIITLMDKYSITRLDILKMDIEGAEEAIFFSNPEVWLCRTEMIIIEIHGPEIELLISRVLKENGFSMRRYRSVWYCRRDGK